MGFDASEPTSIGASAVLGVGAARLGVDAGGKREGRWGEGGGEGRRRNTEKGRAARKSIRAARKAEVDIGAREKEREGWRRKEGNADGDAVRMRRGGRDAASRSRGRWWHRIPGSREARPSRGACMMDLTGFSSTGTGPGEDEGAAEREYQRARCIFPAHLSVVLIIFIASFSLGSRLDWISPMGHLFNSRYRRQIVIDLSTGKHGLK
ncbi:hypothetical protein DFH08DRAFT_804165 [Mycena albidolilacea]|uniref:Uncharacterized protein n=1 Tax=Mycena albidolilacea TaxID=1033008 RepID=A0AAD7AC04_9AGAR|nr:hypothetical protein DFH08DRAFT_804165 [Mycena albidolilacea]